MAWDKGEIAGQVARSIQDGWAVNLGIGLPTLVAGHLESRPVLVHSENGILGMGPRPAAGDEDPDLVDAGKQPTSIRPGGAILDSLTSFALIRGGHLDLAVVGAYQVSQDGDLANWQLPNRRVGGIGGAADLAAGARQVWVAMPHSAEAGAAKLLASCSYPITARGVVSRVFTDLGVFEPAGNGFRVVELAPDVSVQDARSGVGAQILLPEEVAATSEGHDRPQEREQA